MKLSIGVAQTVPIRGDVAANSAQHVRLAQLAASAGAHLLVYPELSLTGYELDLAEQLAFSAADARLSPLVAAASSGALTLVVGAPIRVASRLHIGAFVISPEGDIQLHLKRRLGAFTQEDSPGDVLPPPENSVFEAGTLRPVVDMGEARIALGICAESLRRTHIQEAVACGATAYLTSHFALPSDVAQRHSVLREHARTHGVLVAFASYAGSTGGLRASGRSAIWSPSGALIVELASASEGVAVASEDETGWHGRAIAEDFSER